MITPDEPWMCGNLTTVPYSREEPGTRGGAGVGGGTTRRPAWRCSRGFADLTKRAAAPVWVSCS